jgi:peptide/nickel transport system permease protein
MIVFVMRRLGAALVVAWLAVTLAFVVLRWVPGDALDATMVRIGASDAEIAARRETLGLNDPLVRQYAVYWLDLLRGDLGESLVSGQGVAEMIRQNLGPTAALASSALLFGVTFGMMLGVLASVLPWRAGRYTAEGAASLALSTPVYWTATLAIYVFSTWLGILPGVGGDGVRTLILPAAVLGFHTAGGIAQVTANSLRETAGQDFVRTARAKGLPDLDVLDHILRVGLLPVAAVAALQFGFLLGGTVITEMIFVRRGLGQVMLTAISERDYPVIQGLVALSALVYSLINALADVLYRWIDPRVE